jgi:hypothetical protein
VSHADGMKMKPVKVPEVTRSEKGKDLLVINGFKFRFQKQKFLLTIWNDNVALTKNVNST